MAIKSNEVRETKELLEDLYGQAFSAQVNKITGKCKNRWDAEDIVQSAYEKAFRYAHAYKGPSVERWFNTILHNVMFDYLDDNAKRFADMDETQLLDDIDRLEMGLRRDALFKEISNCKEVLQRQALTLVLIEGHTSIAAAEMLPLSAAAVRGIVFRFKNDFKEKMTELNDLVGI
jgi:RNA polymerase sigma factor (sigma-70 family)